MVKKQSKISIYLKNRGIEAVLKECGYNLRSFKAHLKRECGAEISNTCIYNFRQKAKQLIKSHFTKNHQVEKVVEKWLKENFGGAN